DVAHDAHARPRRIDVGIAHHELLEDVVLDGALQLFRWHALLFRRDDEEGHDGQHGAVHGHAHAHLVQRDMIEEDLHVLHEAGGLRLAAIVSVSCSTVYEPPSGSLTRPRKDSSRSRWWILRAMRRPSGLPSGSGRVGIVSPSQPAVIALTAWRVARIAFSCG